MISPVTELLKKIFSNMGARNFRYLEYEEGRPAEAAQQDHEGSHEPVAAIVGTALRESVADVLGPW